MLEKWKIEELPDGDTHVVRWGIGNNSVSKQMSEDKALHLTSVANKYFKRAKHWIERGKG